MLADGQRLRMTADHPMSPVDAAGSSKSGWVQAGELQPDHHHLTVLKKMSVAVQSVEREIRSERRVSLTIHQPERHLVFVSEPMSPVSQRVQSIAVGSAGMETRLTGPGWKVERTFVVPENHSVMGPQLRRASSAPPGFNRSAGNVSTPRPVRATAHGRAPLSESSYPTVSSDMVSSDVASSVGETRVIVGPAAVLSGVEGLAAGEATRLRDVLEVRRAGLSSLGSAQHESGNCRACVWESRCQHIAAKPCVRGSLCEYCHADHAPMRKTFQARDRWSASSARPVRRAGNRTSPLQGAAQPESIAAQKIGAEFQESFTVQVS